VLKVCGSRLLTLADWTREFFLVQHKAVIVHGIRSTSKSVICSISGFCSRSGAGSVPPIYIATQARDVLSYLIPASAKLRKKFLETCGACVPSISEAAEHKARECLETLKPFSVLPAAVVRWMAEEDETTPFVWDDDDDIQPINSDTLSRILSEIQSQPIWSCVTARKPPRKEKPSPPPKQARTQFLLCQGSVVR
jgi:hypothetical protein